MTREIIEGQTASAVQAARPAKLAHVVVRTKQYEQMVQWYKTVLGARTSFEAPGTVAFLTYDDEHHRIAIMAMPDLADRPARSTGLDHVAFTYAEMRDLVHTYERLKDLGIQPYLTINHGATLSFYYRDPDNNQIEFQVDNFETIEEINAYLAAEFPNTPVGVDIDADEFVRKFHDGVPESELRARPDSGPRGLDGYPSI
jgi:catechol-2,3-dioxygenase